MNLIECEKKYKNYIYAHRENVKKAWESLQLIYEFSDKDCTEIQPLIESHDLSKYTENEFNGYRQWFNPADGEEKEKILFDYAWLYHQHNNPHHHQYWVLNKDNGSLKALDMPFKYIVEMVCDWIGCSYMFGDTAYDFYQENKDKMVLSKSTRDIVEEILKVLNNGGENNK